MPREAEIDPGHGAKLPRRQEQAIAALMSCPTVGAAAASVGVAERTLRSWLKLPGFQKAYIDARQAALQQAMASIHRASSSAVGTLEAVMEDANAPASARVSAAKTVLEMGLRSLDYESLEARIRTLEEGDDQPLS